MGRWFGARTLLTICGALVALLVALAAVQYRWSTRVAAADAQREREHLESAAALFATQFNTLVAEATSFLQNDARIAEKSGEKLAAVPKLIGEVYFVRLPAHGTRSAERLTGDGLFETVSVPAWIAVDRCASLAIEQPPALVAPVYEAITEDDHRAGRLVIRRTVSGPPEHCFVARLDQAYLRQTLFPKLLRESFGETSMREYHFAVVSREHPDNAVYGAPARADVKKALFTIAPGGLLPFSKPPSGVAGAGRSMVFVQRSESTIITTGPGHFANLLGPGVWELEITHKDVPLATAFEQRRRRDLLFSLGIELLLVAAIAFLMIGARRMQQLADQKMQFVAGVSHELRTPVSAITMLARNQADGLVTGVDKVKQYGELIHQQSRRLNEMVEQTLQYAGIHSGLRRPARDQVDLRTLIQEAVEARRQELARSGFQVEIALDRDLPAVVGDEKLLRTAFDNLLSNAEKHACSGHFIRVSAAYFAAEKEVRIGVEDRGAGIDPADQAEIFEPFCRGRAAIEAQIPGSGLGLSLVRSAAEAHHGSITLLSEPGRGSTFTMRLPL